MSIEKHDRAVAFDRQCRPSQRQNVRLEAIDEVATVKMTVSNERDPISEANREKIFDASSPPDATPAARNGARHRPAVMTSHGGTIRLMSTDKGRRVRASAFCRLF